jgi:hypothetical protein
MEGSRDARAGRRRDPDRCSGGGRKPNRCQDPARDLANAFPLQPNKVLGFEAAGVVDALGPGANGVALARRWQPRAHGKQGDCRGCDPLREVPSLRGRGSTPGCGSGERNLVAAADCAALDDVGIDTDIRFVVLRGSAQNAGVFG